VAEDATLGLSAARVTLSDPAGREIVRQVDVPPGDPDRPLTPEMIRHKLARAAGASPIGGRMAAIVAAVDSLEHAASTGPLAAAVSP
jgi:2-methylcitrate dehydratase PrpD